MINANLLSLTVLRVAKRYPFIPNNITYDILDDDQIIELYNTLTTNKVNLKTVREIRKFLFENVSLCVSYIDKEENDQHLIVRFASNNYYYNFIVDKN